MPYLLDFTATLDGLGKLLGYRPVIRDVHGFAGGLTLACSVIDFL